jgi:hypothetical protein
MHNLTESTRFVSEQLTNLPDLCKTIYGPARRQVDVYVIAP